MPNKKCFIIFLCTWWSHREELLSKPMQAKISDKNWLLKKYEYPKINFHHVGPTNKPSRSNSPGHNVQVNEKLRES